MRASSMRTPCMCMHTHVPPLMCVWYVHEGKCRYQKSVENQRTQQAKERPDYAYLIWDEKSGEAVKYHKRLPPPKVTLPGNTPRACMGMCTCTCMCMCTH